MNKEIIKDWLNAFPELTLYGKNRLLKVIGPIIIGLELFHHQRTGNIYSPYLVCYSLSEENEKACLRVPLVMQEIYNNQGFPIEVPYEQHHINFQEAVKYTKQQMRIPLDGNVYLKAIFEMIKYQENNSFRIKSNIVSQAQFFLLKFNVGLYLEDKSTINEAIDNIKNFKSNWPLDLFIWKKYGDENTWFENLQESINHRDEFLRQIEINKQNKRLKKLHVSKIIL